MNEELVSMFMNTYRVSTAPECSKCGDTSTRDVTFQEMTSLRCSVCGTEIPGQVAADAVVDVPMMHLVGDENFAAGMEAIKRAGLRTL
jgi:hypothetical protein